MTVTIEQLQQRLEALPTTTVRFGDVLSWRFSADLAHAQVGYALGEHGESLVTGKPGAWQEAWVVIAHDDHGDPFFVDTSADELPVFTAAHGEGSWHAQPVADSLASFCSLLRIVDELQQRWAERDGDREELIRGLSGPDQLEGDAWQAWKARVREFKLIKKDVSAARTALRQQVRGQAARWWRELFGLLDDGLAETFEELPSSKQDASYLIGQRHAHRHKHALRADARFAEVILCGDYQGRFGVTGTVATEEHADALRRWVEATEPPYPVYFSVRVAAG